MDKLTKIGIILLIAAVVMIVAVYIGEFSGYVSISGTIDQCNLCTSDTVKLNTLGTYYAQSFIPTQNTLNSVQILLNRVHENASGGEIRVSLKETKDGEALVYDELEMSDVEEDTEKWYVFNMENHALIPGETYYIVIQATRETDYPIHLYVCHSDSYKNGKLWKKEPGKDWTTLIESSTGRDNTDMTFQTWGILEVFHENE